MSLEKSRTLIAVDVSKEKLDSYNTITQQHEVIQNNARAIGHWIRRIQKSFDIDKVVLEPTGGYENTLLLQLNKNAVPSFFVHPNKLHHFKKGKGEKAKTDHIDVVNMAEYGLVNKNELQPIRPSHFACQRMKELLLARRQIKQEIHRFKCYSEHKFHTRTVKILNKRLLKQLKRELETLEEAIEDEINQDEIKKKIGSY